MSSHTNRRRGNLGEPSPDRPTDNQSRIEYAKLALHEMAIDVICSGHSGTIGVEVPVKNGKLGKVKRLQVVMQRD